MASELSVLKNFFGYHPTNAKYAGIAGFSVEIKQLSLEERHDLAVEAAKALGVPLD